jgi:hypothetical protein
MELNQLESLLGAIRVASRDDFVEVVAFPSA